MSELRPATPVARPASARRRSEASPQVLPPSPEELERIGRHLVSLPVHEGGSVTDEADLGVHVVRRPGGGPERAYAALPRWSAEGWRSSLAGVRDRMRAEGAWPCVVLLEGLDEPAGLDRELPREGWARVSGERVMWVGHAASVPHLDRGLRIEAVQPPRAEVHEALERSIFGMSEEFAERRREALAAALDTGRLRAYVVHAAGQPVAVARLSQGEGVAALVGIGVTPQRRRQGLGRLITTVVTRAGLAMGNRLVWLSVREDDAAATALYAGLGYQPAFSWSRWLHTSPPGAG